MVYRRCFWARHFSITVMITCATFFGQVVSLAIGIVSEELIDLFLAFWTAEKLQLL
jgi:hypothetical protein